MHHVATKHPAVIGILTVSDTRSEADDRSGQLIRKLFEAEDHTIGAYRLVKDEADHITSIVKEWTADDTLKAIIINGGTGFTPRDVTFEAVSPLLDKEMEGFGELFRSLSYREIGARAMFSRAIAGTTATTAIYALPGSRNAVKLAVESLILPTLPHLIEELVRT